MPDYPLLVGREAELTVLRTAVEATARGIGGCEVLLGHPGIGKSRLLREAARLGAELDIVVAAGRATELDGVAPAQTLMSALRGLRSGTPSLAVTSPGESGSPPLRYIDDLIEALDIYTNERPLLIILDDFQWADEFSALALRILVPALASSPVRWLLARRPVPAVTAGQEAAHFLVTEGALELTLGALDDDAVRRLCSLTLGAPADATVLALTEGARGNPFLINQLLTAMMVAGQIVVSGNVVTVIGTELPSSFVAAVDQRLRGLSAGARGLLTVGSIFGRPFSIHEAARLAGVTAAAMAAPASEALHSGLIVPAERRLDFAHDLLRQAVYDHVPKALLCAMHRDAAAGLREDGRPAVEIAEHLIRSGGTGDREAVRTLRTAAREVAGRAPGAAADLIVGAVAMLDETDPTRSELSAEAVGYLASAGRLVEARAAGEVAMRGDLDGPAEARALLGLAEALKHAGENVAANECVRRGLARPGVPDETRAQLQAVAAHALLWEADMAGADAAGAEADRLGVATGELGASVFGCAARSLVALANGRLNDAVAHALRAVATADAAGGEVVHRHPRIWLGSALASVDRVVEARQTYATGRLEAERLGTAWSIPLWHYHDALALVTLGELDAAGAEAEAGLHIAGQLTARQMSMPLLSLLTTVAVLRDDLSGAREWLRRMGELTAAGVTTAIEDLTWAAAVVYEADERPDLALRVLSDVYDALPGRLMLFALSPGCGPAFVRIAMAAGDRDRADAAAAAIGTLARNNPDVAGLTGAALHAEGLLNDDLDSLRRAVDHFGRSPRRLDRAHAIEDCGQAEAQFGDRARGGALLTTALDEYRACAAHHAAKRTERRLRSLGIRRGGPARPGTGSPMGLLTDAELSVVRKIAEGRTNRQAGEVLHISRHTVDSHLRSAFHKLGVRSRVELTRLVVTQRDEPS